MKAVLIVALFCCVLISGKFCSILSALFIICDMVSDVWRKLRFLNLLSIFGYVFVFISRGTSYKENDRQIPVSICLLVFMAKHRHRND